MENTFKLWYGNILELKKSKLKNKFKNHKLQPTLAKLRTGNIIRKNLNSIKKDSG